VRSKKKRRTEEGLIGQNFSRSQKFIPWDENSLQGYARRSIASEMSPMGNRAFKSLISSPPSIEKKLISGQALLDGTSIAV
jgi:hypothetical protein